MSLFGDADVASLHRATMTRELSYLFSLSLLSLSAMLRQHALSRALQAGRASSSSIAKHSVSYHPVLSLSEGKHVPDGLVSPRILFAVSTA